ncbi:MAG: hypothetical protein L0Z62_12665 [Gemmataceae bacterium]|nr:hypothetical protein [Gemmataceae bacterium]
MRWRKLGVVYCPPGDRWWARAYAHLPTPELLDERVLRVYFASLDDHQYGRIGYADLDARDPTRVLHVSPEPVLDLGEPGRFDDSGVNPSCVVNVGGRRRLYYIGWQRCQRVPYMLFAGAAESADGTFRKLSRRPVLDRTDSEPFLRSATSVLVEGGRYRAWYVSALGWGDVHGTTYPRYVVRHAESADGLSWSDGGPVCIGLEGDEFGIGRPWVVRDGALYRMWYSVRSHSAPYRIGYAESADGLTWTRRDEEAGIDRSERGWDAEMICYPAVIDVGGRRLMFYNGNRHGASGFGVAVLEG